MWAPTPRAAAAPLRSSALRPAATEHGRCEGLGRALRLDGTPKWTTVIPGGTAIPPRHADCSSMPTPMPTPMAEPTWCQRHRLSDGSRGHPCLADSAMWPLGLRRPLRSPPALAPQPSVTSPLPAAPEHQVPQRFRRSPALRDLPHPLRAGSAWPCLQRWCGLGPRCATRPRGESAPRQEARRRQFQRPRPAPGWHQRSSPHQRACRRAPMSPTNQWPPIRRPTPGLQNADPPTLHPPSSPRPNESQSAAVPISTHPRSRNGHPQPGPRLSATGWAMRPRHRDRCHQMPATLLRPTRRQPRQHPLSKRH
jgi:hypothetical protein